MGSRDNGDLTTTNLYIGNINPTVNEEQLCMEFAKYGPIASIKIMWPRTTEEIERNRNCGFVSFMDRADAAIALKEMDGMELMGYVMKLGWGKAVALPAVPFFVHKDYKAPPKPVKVQVRKSIPPSSTDVIVHKPKDPQTLVCIHRVIEKVLTSGHEFEEALIEKESHNPTFAFLVDHKPFKMVDGGPVWVPPLMSFTDEIFEEDERLIEAHEEEFEKSPIKGTLGRGARSFFEAQLRMLTSQRRSIGRAMLFCMRHADAADEASLRCSELSFVSCTEFYGSYRCSWLFAFFRLSKSFVPLPNVWKFRSSFEQKLPVIFEAFNGIYRNIDARLKAEQFRRQISSVLVIWENWIVFPQTYIDNLANVLIRKDPSQQTDSHSLLSSNAASAASHPESKSGFSNTFKVVDQADGDGDGDIDGVPIEDEDIDGVSMKDRDLDGIPMDEDIDGVPMEDEDLDGIPL
ncbi:hypothetical protein BGX26_007238 [Mortierella sp. AD094]|nr:hypothetical protein BGX26_007238 [Mortierella sp. AD094]